MEGRLRRLCEQKPSGTIKVPQEIHDLWKRRGADRDKLTDLFIEVGECHVSCHSACSNMLKLAFLLIILGGVTQIRGSLHCKSEEVPHHIETVCKQEKEGLVQQGCYGPKAFVDKVATLILQSPFRISKAINDQSTTSNNKLLPLTSPECALGNT